MTLIVVSAAAIVQKITRLSCLIKTVKKPYAVLSFEESMSIIHQLLR